MKTSHRVVWTQGMFLTPQHFQTLENHLETSLHFRDFLSHFSNWGVTQLDVDLEALTNGQFRLDTCTGLMPDGEPVNIPDTDQEPPSRAFKDYFPPSRDSLDVYLALPENRQRTRNVTMPGPTRGAGAGAPPETRYLAETRMVVDNSGGEEEKAVQVARRTFRLLFSGEYRDGFSSFRIARVIRNAAGTPILDPQFIAPCLNISSSRYLMNLLRKQIEILANKSATLSAPRRQRSKLVAEFSASDTAQFWLLHTVNSYLPELNHLWKVRQGHPELAYVSMLRLAGALSTFSLEGHPENLPDYDHENLGACFTALDAKVRELMQAVIPENFISIPLEVTDRFLWTGKVAEDAHFRDSQFFLAVSAKMGVDDLIRKVPVLLKISSPESIRHLVQNSMPGVVLRHMPSPPDAIPVKLDNQYFAINQSGPLWDAIIRSRQIAVSAPGEIVDPKMEVVIVLG